MRVSIKNKIFMVCLLQVSFFVQASEDSASSSSAQKTSSSSSVRYDGWDDFFANPDPLLVPSAVVSQDNQGVPVADSAQSPALRKFIAESSYNPHNPPWQQKIDEATRKKAAKEITSKEYADLIAQALHIKNYEDPHIQQKRAEHDSKVLNMRAIANQRKNSIVRELDGLSLSLRMADIILDATRSRKNFLTTTVQQAGGAGTNSRGTASAILEICLEESKAQEKVDTLKNKYAELSKALVDLKALDIKENNNA